MATSAQQAANIRAFNAMTQKMGSGIIINSNGSKPTQYSSSSAPASSAPGSVAKAPVSGGGYVAPRAGTVGNAAGSQAPVAPIVPPKSGTVGNPAGSKLPTGTAAVNAKAAQTASAIGITKPKEDWRASLDINRQGLDTSNVSSGDYGMTKNPNYVEPVKQTASVFDAFQATQQNRVNADTQTLGLGSSSGSNIPVSYQNMMTQSNGSNAVNRPVVSPSMASIQQSSAPLGGNSPAPINNTASALTALQRTSGSPAQQDIVAPQTQPPVAPSTGSTQSTGGTQTQTNPVSKIGMSNVTTKAPTLDEQQAAAGIADETRAQADAAQQAADAAQTSEDRAYYQQLADSARSQADAAQAEYDKLLQQSDEERAIQAQLDAETNALQLGKTDVAGQAIPLAFITGQQSALERRSLDRTAPLSSKLGQLQAARQAAMAGARSKAGIAENRAGTAESNLTALTTEDRKRQQQLADQTTKRANEVEDRNYKAANTPVKTTTSTPSGVKANTYKDVQQVPEELRNSVVDDIVMNQGDLPSIIAAYPEISPSVLQAMFNQFSMQGKGLNGGGSSGDITNPFQ